MGEILVNEAQLRKCCRICEEPLNTAGMPKHFYLEFDKLILPKPSWIFKFGKEFAHERCLAALATKGGE